MAPGVKKAYKRLYSSNLGKMLEYTTGLEDGADVTKAICKNIEAEQGVYPCMAWDNNYMEIEAEALKQYAEREG
jgi:ribonucleoside-triphosphate reductase